MAVFHDEIEIEDFDFDEDTETFTYPCPCGDLFRITKEELEDGEDIARCPSCSLIVRVIYDEADFESDDDADNAEPATPHPNSGGDDGCTDASTRKAEGVTIPAKSTMPGGETGTQEEKSSKKEPAPS
eukprot:m.339263 g.339263  ORF g.339263 m.339263 type:complete len:128 (+) comp20580_c0_seq1:206-589(+)